MLILEIIYYYYYYYYYFALYAISKEEEKSFKAAVVNCVQFKSLQNLISN